MLSPRGLLADSMALDRAMLEGSVGQAIESLRAEAHAELAANQENLKHVNDDHPAGGDAGGEDDAPVV